MKVLAIRGENLASLDARFEIDMAQGPLAGAGLFVITGPTGAGKSTLLDALCLALYDETPRLTGKSTVMVGRGDDEKERMGSNDVRSILRRGAGSGFAEVDFVGGDGRRYRSRWSVQRARKKAGGAVQKASLELRDLETDRAIGGTKTETLREIVSRTGLAFDQFRRSVLLAQGDFAAFLRANAADRGELLERMTGSEIYGRISTEAFVRARAERDAFTRIELEGGAIVVFTPIERVAAEAERAVLSSALDASRSALTGAEAALAWHIRRAALERDERAGAESLAAAEAAVADAAPARAELSAVVHAEPLRPTVDALDRAIADHERARTDQAARSLEARAAADAAALAGARESEALTAASDATTASEAARPALAAARALDVRLGEAARAADGAAREWANARTSASEAASRVTTLDAGRRAEATRESQAAAYLETCAAVRPLALEWTRWRRELSLYQDGALALVSAQDRRPPALGRLTKAERALAAASGALEAASRAHAEADAGLARAALAAAAISTTGLREERESLTAQRGALESLLGAGAEARTADAEAAAEHARAGEWSSAAGRARSESEAASLERRLVEERLAEADGTLRRLRSALDLDARRAELEDGVPCALCGAPDHPWGHTAPAFGTLTSEQEGRVRALGERRTALATAQAAAEARRVASDRAAGDAAARASRHEERRAAALDRWRASREAKNVRGLDAIATSPLEPQAVERARDLLAHASAAQAQIARAEAEAEERRRSVEAARAALDAARASRDAAAEGVRTAEKRRDEARQALADLDLEVARWRSALDERAAALEEAFRERAGWRARLDEGPAAFQAACEQEARAYLARQEEQERAREAIAALDVRLSEARTAAAAMATEATARELLAAREAEALAALRRERQGLLGGAAADAFESALKDRARRAQGALDAARGAAAGARAAAQAAGALRDEAVRALAAREAALTAARGALSRALAPAEGPGPLFGAPVQAQAPLDEPALRALLARGSAWIAAREAEERALERALHAARTVLEERRLQRVRHEAGPSDARPAGTSEEAALALEQARAALDLADGRLRESRIRLETDDEARRKKAGILPRLEAQRERLRVWETLNGLIGSEDGRRFRTFAQSLTLDALTGHANAYLHDLAPRYAIERIPKSDLDLQVIDHDLGDEVRGVQGLSGGESFLVSLALALGLSSLAAGRARIECLFIDEGFGTLDPDTLDAAMSALDGLQAGGRTIGLISHVPGLAERIGVQVQVRPRGGGRSDVRVVGAA